MADALLKPQDSSAGLGIDGSLDEREPFAAFVTDEDSREILQSVIATQSLLGATVETGGLADAVRTYGVLPAPAILLVDLCESDSAVADLRALRDAVAPDTIIITVGTTNDVTLYRALTEAGAADYLIKPLSVDMVEDAIERANRPPPLPESKETRHGKLVLVIGARGGIGASTIALNCAWGLAHENEKRVALVDLDLQYGTQALSLDLEPGHGLREALESPDRVDELFIDRAMAQATEQLFVFGAEEALDAAPAFESEAVTGLLSDLQSRFDCIVVDLPRLMVGERREILETADDIVLVTDLSLVALRDTLRLKRLADENAPGTRIHVVANRLGAKGGGQLSLKDFEKGFNGKVPYTVLYDDKLAAKAANIGQPIVKLAKRSKPAQTLLKLSAVVAGNAPAPGEDKKKGAEDGADRKQKKRK